MRGEPLHAQPKPTPAMLKRSMIAAAYRARDEAETRKARARAAGRCEVTVDGRRCPRRDSETHHVLGVWRRRGRGNSALAVNKLRVCRRCHAEITGHVLQPLGGHRYRRVT